MQLHHRHPPRPLQQCRQLPSAQRLVLNAGQRGGAGGRPPAPPRGVGGDGRGEGCGGLRDGRGVERGRRLLVGWRLGGGRGVARDLV